MQAQNYSRTAQYMALGRALEYTLRAPEQRILSDPWAVRFIPSRPWRFLASFPPAGRLVAGFFQLLVPGAQEYSVARARLVDDLTRQQAQSGLEQLVLLGAGFDTTIFRLKDCLRKVHVFEVDHHTTQAAKKSLLPSGAMPGMVTFVPVDFEKDEIVDRLRAAGFDPGRRTLITWLGVSYYLTEQAVERTLNDAGKLCRAGGQLIFDYALESVIAHRNEHAAARKGFRFAARLGEPFIHGLNPAHAASYLARFGFKLLTQYEGRDLQRLYCTPGRAPVDFTRVAHCERVP